MRLRGINVSRDLFFEQNTDSESHKALPSAPNQIAAAFLQIDMNMDVAEGDVTF